LKIASNIFSVVFCVFNEILTDPCWLKQI